MGAPEENQAVGQVEGRLAGRFPSVPPERIRQVVDEEFRKLETGAVQDFVPVLVEHAAMERLRQEADPVPMPLDDRGPADFVRDDPPELDPMEIQRREREHRGGFLFGDLGGGPA
jgi:hypothetical protein